MDALTELYANRAEAHGYTQGRAAVQEVLAMDIELNAQGLEVWLERHSTG
jgi:hypothetical protein